MAHAIALRGITKRFNGTLAVDVVNSGDSPMDLGAEIGPVPLLGFIDGLANMDINIEGFCEVEGKLHLVTSDPPNARKALETVGFVVEEREVFVIEANPNPQLAYGEDFAEAAEKAGIDYGPLLERIMALGLAWEPGYLG